MHEELKPCPFCGSKNIVVRKYTAVAGVHYYVQCDSANGGCGAEFESRISRKDAIKAWNKRVEEVVHCKECKWRGIEECAMFYECDCGEQHTWETDDDFCSYGERAEQELRRG